MQPRKTPNRLKKAARRAAREAAAGNGKAARRDAIRVARMAKGFDRAAHAAAREV